MIARFVALVFDFLVNKLRISIWTSCSDSPSRELISQWRKTTYEIMRSDRRKIEFYKTAVKDAAKGKVVLDIGTGAFAVLAEICAAQGAEKVFALEANFDAYKHAVKYIRNSPFKDKINIIHGYSEDITLPAKADILVHDLIGGMGTDEGMLPVIEDAKHRLLIKNALFVPFASKVMIVPVSRPPRQGRLFSLIAELIKKLFWGISEDKTRFSIWNFPKNCFLSTPQVYENTVFSEKANLESDSYFSFKVEKNEIIQGLLFWNVLISGKGDSLDCFSSTHWPSIYMPFINSQIRVQTEDIITIRAEKFLSRKSSCYRFFCSLNRGNITVWEEIIRIGDVQP